MAKQVLDLDTPYKRGEKVLTTRPLPGIAEGTSGKVKLTNGFDQWNRYWVRLNDGRLVGHIDHNDLVRPNMLSDWRSREADRAAQAEAAAAGVAAAPAEVSAGSSDGGVASLIPAALLERSKAAKARLTGG